MRRNYFISASIALALSLSACGKDVDSESPSLFGFSGEWSLTPGVFDLLQPCTVRLRNSSLTASCETRDDQVFRDEFFNQAVNLDADGEVSETRISLSGTWSRGETYGSADSTDTFVCDLTWSGTANRLEGREVDGRFSALAGRWSGTATTEVTCSSQIGDEPPQVRDRDRIEITFNADIFGDAGEVRWQRTGWEGGESVQTFGNREGSGLQIGRIEIPELGL